MKKQRLIILLSGLLLVGMACNSNSSKSGNDSGMQQNESVASNAKYTCPMHPEVVSDHPGNCPKCGMKLEKVKDNADSTNTPKADSMAM